MKKLFYIEINIDQLITELWITNALANGCQMIIVLLKDYCSLLIVVIQILMVRWLLLLTDTHIPPTVK